jgi:hypothetical protein
MIAASSGNYLGFGGPDMSMVYYFGLAIALLAVALLIFRGFGVIAERRQTRKSSWKTFRNIALARGLKHREIDILTTVVRKSKIKRPAQALGSIQVFERCVSQSMDRGDLTELEIAIVGAIRERLLSAAAVEPRKKNEERRQHLRAPCSLPVSCYMVPRDSLRDGLHDPPQEGDPKFNELISELSADLVPVNAQIIDVSAGGAALLIRGPVDVDSMDYVSISGDADALPVDLNGFIAQVTDFNKVEGQDSTIVRMRFTPYENERRKEIIKLVYENLEAAKSKPKPKRKKKPGSSKTAGESPGKVAVKEKPSG